MNIIECKNLTKEYISGDNTVKAVNNISVCFEKGEFCAVTGPSGSGKSTFIHMLSDALSSVAVVIGAIFIYFWNVTWLDPVLTILVSLFVLHEAYPRPFPNLLLPYRNQKSYAQHLLHSY